MVFGREKIEAVDNTFDNILQVKILILYLIYLEIL